MKEKLLKTYRPLIFLCGPAINKKNSSDDRRIMVYNCISSKKKRIELDDGSSVPFYIIPVIVDDILDDEFMLSHNLEYKKTEEIIASIAHRTYIFLDSLSSSYELGLFDSSLNKNISYVFLEKDFLNRKNRTVGDYILKSINPDHVITYEYEYANKEREFVTFPKNKYNETIIPKEIKQQIDVDYKKLQIIASRGSKITFSNSDNDSLDTICYSFFPNETTITFSLNVRLAFYLSIISISNRMMKQMDDNNEYERGLIKLKDIIFDLFLDASIDNNREWASKDILFRPNVILKIGKYDSEFETFKYFMCISNRITLLMNNKRTNSLERSLRSNRKIKPSFSNRDFSFFGNLFSMKKYDYGLIEDYQINPNEYVEEKILVISGKKRKIVEYKDTHKGRHLRRIHERMAEQLCKYFPPSINAFAYKKESSTKKCVEQHLESVYFYKIDIQSFFNSIEMRKTASSIKNRLISDINRKYKSLIPTTKVIENIISCCFYKGKLPLGFVTSPILSDIYLNDFDRKINDTFDSVVYTRYADDILISSRRKIKQLSKCKELIETELKRRNLNINPKKKASVHLKSFGDSIHYLGINIVKRKDGNELTISKSFILNAIYKINYEMNKNNVDYSKIKGLCQYVESISPKSFTKMERSFLAIFKKPITYHSD